MHETWRSNQLLQIGLTTKVRLIEIRHTALTKVIPCEAIGFNVIIVDVKDLRDGHFAIKERLRKGSRIFHRSSSHPKPLQPNPSRILDCHTVQVRRTTEENGNRRSGEETREESQIGKLGRCRHRKTGAFETDVHRIILEVPTP